VSARTVRRSLVSTSGLSSPGMWAKRGVEAAHLTVCHMITSLRYGGAERQFVNLLNHLPCERKYVVLMRAESPTGLAPLLENDIQVFSLGVKRGRYVLSYVMRLARLLRQLGVDILHTHTFWPNLYGSLAVKLAGIPVFVTSEHGKNEWKTPVHRWVEQKVISGTANMRICVSQDILRIRRDVEGIPASKLVYIPNGTIVPEVKRRDDFRSVTIGTVGRLVKAKDYPVLIRAMKMLRDNGRDYKLIIIGDGPERETLQNEVRRLGLEDVVQMPGFQSDIDLWLQRFSIFVMSSIREGQPLALLEAMASGLPVVATKVGGIPETVQDGSEGIIVEPGNPKALANAIKAVAKNEMRHQMGKKARERVRRDYSIDVVCAQYLDLYRRLMVNRERSLKDESPHFGD
jgi:glycosyltransferase involved in cell wall biosynthesis